VCARHPEQGEEPTAHSRTIRPNSTDFVDYLKERVERIDFFLKWYPTDRRATEALESEKAELEEQIRQA
jgi:hypothetical protein